MPLLDERGRVFGRINLIDLVVMIVAISLLPLGYGAYVLFRQPRPRVTRLSPNRIVYSAGEQRIGVTGEDFRPYLRAALGSHDARAFIVEGPTTAELRFTDLAPCTYDP